MLKAVEETFLGQILFGNSFIFGDLASEKKSKFLKSQIYYIFSRGGVVFAFYAALVVVTNIY